MKILTFLGFKVILIYYPFDKMSLIYLNIESISNSSKFVISKIFFSFKK